MSRVTASIGLLGESVHVIVVPGGLESTSDVCVGVLAKMGGLNMSHLAVIVGLPRQAFGSVAEQVLRPRHADNEAPNRS